MNQIEGGNKAMCMLMGHSFMAICFMFLCFFFFISYITFLSPFLQSHNLDQKKFTEFKINDSDLLSYVEFICSNKSKPFILNPENFS